MYQLYPVRCPWIWRHRHTGALWTLRFRLSSAVISLIMNDSCRLNCDYILLFNNSDSSIGGGHCGPWHLLFFCTGYFVHLTQIEASLSMVCYFLVYWTADTFFFPFQICFCMFLSFPNMFLYVISFNCKKGTRNGETLSVSMHICSPTVLTFLRKISNGWANSTLQWHVSLNSDYYTGRRVFTTVVQLNAFPSVRCTEDGGIWRIERPYRAPDRCWRVNLDLHSQIHFSVYMLPKPNSVIFRCLRLLIERFYYLRHFCPSVRMYRLGTHGTDYFLNSKLGTLEHQSRKWTFS